MLPTVANAPPKHPMLFVAAVVAELAVVIPLHENVKLALLVYLGHGCVRTNHLVACDVRFDGNMPPYLQPKLVVAWNRHRDLHGVVAFLFPLDHLELLKLRRVDDA